MTQLELKRHVCSTIQEIHGRMSSGARMLCLASFSHVQFRPAFLYYLIMLCQVL